MPELVNIVESLWIRYGPALNYFSKPDGARFAGNMVHRTIVDFPQSIPRRQAMIAQLNRPGIAGAVNFGPN
jgi:hypothetical protein